MIYNEYNGQWETYMVNEVRQRFILTTSIVFIVVLMAIMMVLYVVMDQSFYSTAQTSAFSITNSVYIGINEVIFDGADIGAFISKDPFIVDTFFSDEINNVDKLSTYLNTAEDIYEYDNIYIASYNTNKCYNKTGYSQSFSELKETDLWFYDRKEKATPTDSYSTLNAVDADGNELLYLTYVIFDETTAPQGMVLIGLDYDKSMTQIYKSAEQLNTKIFLVTPDYSYDALLTSDDNVDLSFIDKSLIETIHDEQFHFYELNNQFVSIKFSREMNRYLIVVQELSNHLMNSFLLTGTIILLVLVIIAIILLKIFSDSSKKIMQHASLDTLTGVMTRRSYNSKIEEALELCQNYQIKSSLIFIDIDHFKTINDTKGHDFGDMIIKDVAKLLKDSKRSDDYLFRWGGDEFAIIARCSLDHALRLSKRILDGAQEIEWAEGKGVTLSIGVSEVSPKDTKKECFNRVDEALYYAKEQGRNQICYL